MRREPKKKKEETEAVSVSPSGFVSYCLIEFLLSTFPIIVSPLGSC